jgi:hypothetical protein
MRDYVGSRVAANALKIALLGVAAVVLSGAASAQSVSCFLAPAKLHDSIVEKFTTTPALLLADYPRGGPGLISAAQRLAGSDVRTVDALIEIARSAAPEIKADIASGLANTAASCVWTRPDIAHQIQQKIDASSDPAFVTTFRSVLRGGGAPVLGGTGGPSAPTMIESQRNTTRVGPPVGAPAGGEASPAASITVDRLGITRRGLGAAGVVLDSTDSGQSTTAAGSKEGPNSLSSGRLFRPDASVSPTMQ